MAIIIIDIRSNSMSDIIVSDLEGQGQRAFPPAAAADPKRRDLKLVRASLKTLQV